MKVLGILLIVGGLALFAYLGYHFVKEKQRTISPVPESRGIKVIFVTPGK